MTDTGKDNDRASGCLAWLIYGPIIVVLLGVDWLFSGKKNGEDTKP